MKFEHLDVKLRQVYNTDRNFLLRYTPHHCPLEIHDKLPLKWCAENSNENYGKPFQISFPLRCHTNSVRNSTGGVSLKFSTKQLETLQYDENTTRAYFWNMSYTLLQLHGNQFSKTMLKLCFLFSFTLQVTYVNKVRHSYNYLYSHSISSKNCS